MNDFAAPVIRTSETAATAAAAQSKALVEARYTVAMHRPRDMDVVREKLLKECRRPSFAECVQYRKPMGKRKNEKTGEWEQQYVEGPSIRLAEAAIRCMGNIVVQEVTSYDDDEKRIIEVSVTDLESNTVFPSSITINKTVERKKKKDGDEVIRERTNSYGDKVFILRATEDELLNKKNAMLSKAIRTNGLRLVPGDLVDECVTVALETTRNQDAKDPDAARRKILDAFAALNVSVEDLKKYAGDLGKLSPKDIAELRALHAAIKDGETTWRAAMEAKFPEAGGERFQADLGKAPPKDPPKDAPAGSLAPTPEKLASVFGHCATATTEAEAIDVLLKATGKVKVADVPADKIAAAIAALTSYVG